MALVEVRRRITAQRELVWRIVSDFSGDAGTPPGAVRVEHLGGEGQGLSRRVIGADGAQWEESCEAWEPGRMFTMRVQVEGFPVACERLRYTCSLGEEQGGLLVRLYYEYRPRFGSLGTWLDRFSTRPRLEQYARQQLDNWIRLVHTREWVYRVTARRIIREKGGHVHSVQPETPVAEVAQLLAQHRIGAALVLDPDGSIAGVLSERDIVRALATAGADVLQQPVAGIMTSKVITAGPDDNMMTVMSLMSEKRIRHLPVVADGQVLGLISIGDVIKARMSELEGESETLLEYIEARRWHELYKELGPAAYSDATLR